MPSGTFRSTRFRRGGFSAALLALAPTLSAQNILYAEYAGKLVPVRGAHGTQAVIEANGRRVTIEARRFSLQPFAEYLPLYVTVRKLAVNSHDLAMYQPESRSYVFEHYYAFEFSAIFESSAPLTNVLHEHDIAGKLGHTIYQQQVGALDPRSPKRIRFNTPLRYELGTVPYQLHLFANGLELLHSKQPPALRDAALDRMVAKRIADVRDAGPKLLLAPPPEYPPALVAAKTKGTAHLRLSIRTNGAVLDPVVIDATDPAFGAAAVAAVRLWRFLPRVVDGVPVVTEAELPFGFEPPTPP